MSQAANRKETLKELAALAESLTPEIEQGIVALRKSLGAANEYLREVKPRAREIASFELPLFEDYLGQSRVLQIGFPPSFPRKGLTLKIDPSPWLKWPHVSKDGLCLYADQRPLRSSPEEAITETMSRLIKLMRWALPETSHQDRNAEFQLEITSYWTQQCDGGAEQLILPRIPDSAGPLYALTDPRARPKDGRVNLWLSHSFRHLLNYEARLRGGAGKMRGPAQAAFYADLVTVPDIELPAASDVLGWLRPHMDQGSGDDLAIWLAASSHLPLRYILLRLPGNSEIPLVVAFTLRSYGITRSAKPNYGRRAGLRKAVERMQAPRGYVQWAELQILDRAIVHSRDMKSANSLKDAHVVFVGVGSLGSGIAIQLARSGVQRMTLIDPDTFNAANIGRHVLGIDDLGRQKVAALRERIAHDVPSTELAAIPEFVQISEKAARAISSADIVIVSTADWPSELWLWEAKRNGAPWALIQAWSETNGLAGHVLVSPKNSNADGSYLFTSTGKFHKPVTKWEDGIIRLAACGESYIPGGAVALGSIISMTAGAAIDTMTGELKAPQWYSLVPSKSVVESAGGTFLWPAPGENVRQAVQVDLWPPISQEAERDVA